ncbi:MAG: HEAT repeat domain-containing protein [Pyrinomonadaceae bacterium]|nr:HEAT repeat domain-containing protein [Pyrinomonadaceae bacterium]
MKRLYSAIALCASLLLIEAAIFLPHTAAKEDPIGALLRLPAPPPPNPLNRRNSNRTEEFYSKSKPPKDDAPIEDLLDYWAKISNTYQDLRYSPEPSDKAVDRLMSQIDSKPELLTNYLNALPKNERSAEFVKKIYDREGTTGAIDKESRSTIKRWLVYNSPYFTNELYRAASGAGDTESYVSNHDELLALVRVDFDKAKPLIDRLQTGGSRKASRALAAWALYRHAIATDSLGDIERYRDELKSIVEDKTLGAPMRDLAMDGLVAEKEWPGRDEWYMSLLGDETLADMGGYTGLTTLVLISPEEKYIEKMVELLKSDNPVVRAAAVRNLLTRINTRNPEIIKAMLPWLEDRNWAKETGEERRLVIDALRTLKIPESVPGLLKVLDEKGKRPVYAANAMANAANTAANAAGWASNSVRYPETNSNTKTAVAEEEYFPHRTWAIWALGHQADPRAAQPLRRLLPEVEGYERNNIVNAILACKGFSVAEQLDALEWAAKRMGEIASAAAASMAAANAPAANGPYTYNTYADNRPMAVKGQPITAAELRSLIGNQLMQASEVSDELATAVIDRIAFYDTKDPNLDANLRRLVLRWQNSAISRMLLSDVKRDKATVDAMVRLLAQRAELREKQSQDVFDLRSGSPTSVGIAACMLEDVPEYQAILDGENVETKLALFACGRLIRAPLPLAKSIELMGSGDKRLATAAERYLESEDSPQARAAVLARHQGEAKIMGATTAFFGDSGDGTMSEYLIWLFLSVAPESTGNNGYTFYQQGTFKDAEEALIKDVKADAELRGIYSYDGNFVRIYNDKVIFTWDHDSSRYRERELSKFEFDELKSYLTENRVDELAPFLNCPDREYCAPKELVMLGRNGGRRVYMAASPTTPFIVGLDKYFEGLKATPGTVKYEMSRMIPGLEILLADDNLHVETVWKEGDDLRAAATDMAIRKKVEAEIDEAIVEVDPDAPSPGISVDGMQSEYEVREKLRVKREFEGYSWRSIVNGADAGPALQPPGVEFIPLRDGSTVQSTVEQWKARVGETDIRADGEGLYKAVRGKLTRIRTSFHASPVVTPNGRWVAAYKYDEEEGPSLVRINLSTNKEFKIDVMQYTAYYPTAFVPTVNKILLVEQREDGEHYDGYGESEPDDTVSADPEASQMMLLDPETGTLQPIAGEFRPLAQQTFRQLQKTAKPNEFWAAIPDLEKNETAVGLYDTKVFGFKTILKVPKMTFNSMSMWVDEPGKCIYFVYRGHLLKLPFGK